MWICGTMKLMRAVGYCCAQLRTATLIYIYIYIYKSSSITFIVVTFQLSHIIAMSQFFFPSFFGFPLHTFSLINPIFSLSTHHLPIKQTANVYTLNDFPIVSKLLSIQQSIILFLSLTYHLLIKKTAYLPIKTFNCRPLDLKPTDLIFYI